MVFGPVFPLFGLGFDHHFDLEANKAKGGLDMPALSWAIGEGHWELAALCLLLGMVEVISQLPPDAVDGLIEVLDGKKG